MTSIVKSVSWVNMTVPEKKYETDTQKNHWQHLTCSWLILCRTLSPPPIFFQTQYVTVENTTASPLPQLLGQRYSRNIIRQRWCLCYRAWRVSATLISQCREKLIYKQFFVKDSKKCAILRKVSFDPSEFDRVRIITMTRTTKYYRVLPGYRIRLRSFLSVFRLTSGCKWWSSIGSLHLR